MDNGTKVSFIPKKPLSRRTERRTRPVSFLLFASFFIFFITLASYGGLYFYYANLKTVLDNKTKELEVAKEKADPTGAIEKAEKLQVKINNTKNLLNKHVAPSKIFNLLEEVTLKSIVLNGFTLEKRNKQVNQVESKSITQAVSTFNFVVNTSGVAQSYASLAYQSDILKKEIKENNRIESFLITNLSPNEKGEISFTLEIVLRAPFLSYKDTVKDTVNNFDSKIIQKVVDKKSLDSVLNKTSSVDSEKVSVFDSIFNFFKNLMKQN